MKQVLTSIVLLFSIAASGQPQPVFSLGNSQEILGYSLGGTDLYRMPTGKTIVAYDTIVYFVGEKIEHEHQFVKEKKTPDFKACAVMHGPEGCDWNWLKEKQICTVCLRHIFIQETRAYIPPPPEVDEYAQAVERLNKKK